MKLQIERQQAEEATGIVQAGGVLRIFHKSDETNPITPEEACGFLEDGETVEVPAAGAGSYIKLAQMMGLEVARTLDNSASSGDWAFELADGRVLTQANRFPFHGFSYAICNQPGDDW